MTEPAATPPAKLHPLANRLVRQGYHLAPVLEPLLEAALGTRPTAGAFLTGPAGSGKTFLAEAIAAADDRRLFFFQAFPGCRKEELFQTILPDASQPSGFKTVAGVLPQAAEASLQHPTTLILDEWDKTHPSTDAFLLDFLQSGRISVPGSEIKAHQPNLQVFITLNEEREVSEPLLRRMPLVEMAPPPPALVARALQDTHPNHPHLPAVLTLYRRSQMVALSKPVTIQELRQLLDAISQLEGQADWNRLVFQFVTKNWEDHELLKSTEKLPLATQTESARSVLDPLHYAYEELPDLDAFGVEVQMPKVQRDWLEQIPSKDVQAEKEQVFGVVPGNRAGYDAVARAALSTHTQTGDDPAHLRIAQVGEGEIIVFEALDFEHIEAWGPVLKAGGEMLLEHAHQGELSRKMLLAFQEATQLEAQGKATGTTCQVYSLTDTEMLMGYMGLKIRHLPQQLEVVAKEFEPAHTLWKYLFGTHGVLTEERLALSKPQPTEVEAANPNQQLLEDYLTVLRDYRYLRQWFSLLLRRNIEVWGRVTCSYQNRTVQYAAIEPSTFNPDNEAPSTKEEADAIRQYRLLNQPCVDYFEGHRAQVESELLQFVTRNGEFPPAVDDGGVFSPYEFQVDLPGIKKEGLKLYMRKHAQES